MANKTAKAAKLLAKQIPAATPSKLLEKTIGNVLKSGIPQANNAENVVSGVQSTGKTASNQISKALSDISAWGAQGNGYHSANEYDKPLSDTDLVHANTVDQKYAGLANADKVVRGDTLPKYGDLSDVEQFISNDPNELPEGRSKPNHGLDLATDSMLAVNPSKYGELVKAENEDGVDVYNPVLALADVINGGAQNLAHARQLLTGTTDDRIDTGKVAGGKVWTADEIANAQRGWDSSVGFVSLDSIPASEDELVQAGDYIQLTDGRWLPIDDLNGFDEANLLAKSNGKTANSLLLDDLPTTYTRDGKEFHENLFNVIDSSQGNPANIITGNILGGEDKWDPLKTPAFAFDGITGSLPYFFKPTRYALTAARSELAANGYDPDSYDVTDGTYDDFMLNNHDRALSTAGSVAEMAIEPLGGYGAKKLSGSSLLKDGPLDKISRPLDKYVPTRVIKSSLEEGLEEVPTEALGTYADSTATTEEDYLNPENVTDYWADKDKLTTYRDRMIQAFGAGATMGAAMKGGQEISDGTRKRLARQQVARIQEAIDAGITDEQVLNRIGLGTLSLADVLPEEDEETSEEAGSEPARPSTSDILNKYKTLNARNDD